MAINVVSVPDNRGFLLDTTMLLTQGYSHLKLAYENFIHIVDLTGVVSAWRLM